MKYLNYVEARVWWMPQVPMKKPFHVKVSTEEEAILILDTLARYDMFQFKNNIKPDYSNAGGLEVKEQLEGDDWCGYYNEDDMDIDEIMKTDKED